MALVGESGAGKSTLLSALQSQMKNKAALIPQDLGLVNNLSVFHNIYIGRLNSYSSVYNLLNLAWPQRREIGKIKPLVERLGLVENLFKPTGELSGGQQQRVAIARALVTKAPIIVADEPTGDLDRDAGAEILELLAETNREFGRTVVMVTHDPKAAAKAKTVVHFEKGKLEVGGNSVI